MSEQMTGYIMVESRKTMQEILQMAENDLVHYGNPPLSVEATVTDGNGNTYRGTLYLVKKEEANA